jgi:glycopeptide antibiotics resistance protein
VFDVTNCAVTLDIIILALGLLGLCIVWSHYKTAWFIVYLSSMYWAYTLYQTHLLQMMGQNAFYWSGAAAIALGSLLLAIINLMPGRR